MSVYTVSPGFHVKPKAAEPLAAAFRQLEKRLGGSVSRADLVEAARKARSPFHAYFEWEDGVAAEQYRLIQAGYLMRALDVTIEERGPNPVRAMLSIGKGAFISTEYADGDLIRLQVDMAKRDAKAFYERYIAWVSFAEFQPVREVMEAAKRLAEET